MTALDFRQPYKHSVPKKVFPFIVQIGTGGTGGYVVQHLAQLLGSIKIPHAYVLADPDVIETKNLRNQLFLEEEVGLQKADVLAQRYSAAYGLSIGSFTEGYIESQNSIRKLYSSEYMLNIDNDTVVLPILISCVDNNFSRQIMHDFFTSMKQIVYIDAGNESVNVPSDWQQREKEDWTEQELQAYKESGWSGQVVTGIKFADYYQAPLAEMHPEVLEDMDTIQAPSSLSCTELTASEPQRVIVNKFAALAITNIVQEIFEEWTVTNHTVLFHAKKSYMRGIPRIEKEHSLT